MDIGTAKPTTEQRARVPHHLISLDHCISNVIGSIHCSSTQHRLMLKSKSKQTPNRKSANEKVLDSLPSLGQLLNELCQLNVLNEHLRSEFERWIRDSKKAWQDAGTDKKKQKKLGIELRDTLDEFRWTSGQSDRGFYYLAAMADRIPELASVFWGLIRQELHYRLNFPPHKIDPFGTWYFERFIERFGKSILAESNEKTWLDLCTLRRQKKSTEMFATLVQIQIERVGVTYRARRMLQDIRDDCLLLKRHRVLSDLAQLLERELCKLPTMTTEWSNWCKVAITSIVKRPNEDWFMVSPFFHPIEIHEEERAKIESMIKDVQKIVRASKPLKSLDDWLKHVATTKCKATRAQLANYLITRRKIVDGYRICSGEDRLKTRFVDAKGAMKIHAEAFDVAVEKIIRMKLNHSGAEFDLFVHLLPTLTDLYIPWVPFISRCEDYTENHNLTLTQIETIGRVYGHLDPAYSSECEKSKKRWIDLERNQRRKLPRKKTK